MMTQAKAPFHVLIKPTGAMCNLACDYCFYLDKRNLYPDKTSFRMSDEVLEALTAQYIGGQSECAEEVNFSWQGGEPTLMGLGFFRKAVNLQRKHAREGLRAANSLQTNGVLLDDEWCGFLRDENFLVGISVDGPERLHDKHRHRGDGQGTFSDVMRGIEALRRHNVEFNTLTAVHRANGDYPREIYDFLKDAGSRFFQFIPIVESSDRGVSERTVEPAQYGRFLNGIFDHWLEKDDVGTVFVQQFDMMLGMVMGLPASLCVHSEVCGRNAAMEHNGDLYSCDHFVDRNHYLGNIADSTLVDMIDSECQSRFGKAKSDSLPATCRECEFLRYCYGACPKDRLSASRDGNERINWLCGGYRMFYDHVSPVLDKMAVCLRMRRPARDYGRIADPRERPLRTPATGPQGTPGRNDPCPCGSGLKYKKCCIMK